MWIQFYIDIMLWFKFPSKNYQLNYDKVQIEGKINFKFKCQRERLAMWFYLQIWRSRQQKLCWPQSQPTGAPWQKLVVHYVLQFDRKTEQSPKNMSTAQNTRTHINLNHLSRLDSSPRGDALPRRLVGSQTCCLYFGWPLISNCIVSKNYYSAGRRQKRAETDGSQNEMRACVFTKRCLWISYDMRSSLKVANGWI